MFRILTTSRRNILSLSKLNMSTQETDVIFESVKNAGIITLNRPKALNALNSSMTQKILPKLLEWEKTKDLVIIKGAGGKAFCAGGDVKAATDNPDVGKKFFFHEYNCDHAIGYYKKPYIALIDGITMGGGLGLSVHGKYRVATERTLIAMPETKIGLFPDVGGAYFLPRLQANLGLYLGLTGERLKGKDVVKAGIATHYVPSARLFELEKLLVRCKDEADIDKLLNGFNEPVEDFSLNPHLKDINYCFAAGSIEEIYERLEKVNNDWSRKTIETLNQMCPGSLKISLKAIQRGSQMDLAQVLKMDYRMILRSIEYTDFKEGVRALLVDKDNQPKWNPKSLNDVTEEYVESHFTRLPDKDELKFYNEPNFEQSKL